MKKLTKKEKALVNRIATKINQSQYTDPRTEFEKGVQAGLKRALEAFPEWEYDDECKP